MKLSTKESVQIIDAHAKCRRCRCRKSSHMNGGKCQTKTRVEGMVGPDGLCSCPAYVEPESMKVKRHRYLQGLE